MKVVTTNRELEFKGGDIAPFFILADGTLCILTEDGLEEVVATYEDTSDSSI